MTAEKLLIKALIEKLRNEGRTKRWFIEKYCEGMQYNTVNVQLLGYNNIKPEIIKAIREYLRKAD